MVEETSEKRNKIEKIRELLNELQIQKNDFEKSLKIWNNIMSLDKFGYYSEIYMGEFSKFLNEKEYSNKEIVEIWKRLNIKMQKENPEMFDTVLNFATWHPEECLEIWLSTNSDDLEIMSNYKSILTNVIDATLSMENEKMQLYVLQTVFDNSIKVMPLLDKNLIGESLKILSEKDPYTTLYMYENLPEKEKTELLESINMELLCKGIVDEMKNPKSVADIGALFDVIVDSKVPGLPIEEYKKMIEKYYFENPNEVLRTIEEESYMIPKELNYIAISILAAKEQNGEDISKHKKDFEISAKDLEILINKHGIDGLPKDISLNIQMEKISDCTVETLKKMQNKMQDKIKQIYLGDGAFNEYSIQEISELRKVVDELLKDIDYGDANDSRREEKIFGQVIKRLARHIKYDYDEIRNEKQAERLEKKISNTNISENERTKIKYKLKRLDVDKSKITSRNLIGGLLYGKSVCSGYADIAKHVFDCVGIECRKIGGTDKKGEGHAWNQIKIDNKWYNLDLTWDRDLILMGYPARWILKSDKQFENHSEYTVDSVYSVEKCNNNIKKRDMKETVIRGYRTIKEFSKSKKIKNWIKAATKGISIDDVTKVLNELENDFDKERNDNEK